MKNKYFIHNSRLANRKLIEEMSHFWFDDDSFVHYIREESSNSNDNRIFFSNRVSLKNWMFHTMALAIFHRNLSIFLLWIRSIYRTTVLKLYHKMWSCQAICVIWIYRTTASRVGMILIRFHSFKRHTIWKRWFWLAIRSAHSMGMMIDCCWLAIA